MSQESASTPDLGAYLEQLMALGTWVPGAQQLVDWASDKVLAPHLGHANPADHPDCLLCRGLSMLAATGLSASGSARPQPAAPRDAVQWLSVTRTTGRSGK